MKDCIDALTWFQLVDSGCIDRLDGELGLLT